MNSKIAVLLVTAAIVSTLAGFLPQQSFAATVNVSTVSGAANLGNKAFSPDQAMAAVGDTVTWTNKDTTLHTITSGTTPTADNKFDSVYTFAPGKTFSVTFNASGTYPYFCKLHPSMIGVVMVGGAAGGNTSGNSTGSTTGNSTGSTTGNSTKTPEFPVAAIVLAASIIGVVAVSRTRFNFFKGL